MRGFSLLASRGAVAVLPRARLAALLEEDELRAEGEEQVFDALVGDAAHTIHPLAGQGANLGYGDITALLSELERAFRRGQSPGDLMVLERYQRRRKGENLSMMAAMEGFKQLFARNELPVKWLRSTGMRWLDRVAPLKNRVAAQAMGL